MKNYMRLLVYSLDTSYSLAEWLWWLSYVVLVALVTFVWGIYAYIPRYLASLGIGNAIINWVITALVLAHAIYFTFEAMRAFVLRLKAKMFASDWEVHIDDVVTAICKYNLLQLSHDRLDAMNHEIFSSLFVGDEE